MGSLVFRPSDPSLAYRSAVGGATEAELHAPPQGPESPLILCSIHEYGISSCTYKSRCTHSVAIVLLVKADAGVDWRTDIEADVAENT